MSAPFTRHIHQVVTELIPIGWDFTQSVDGGTFELQHSLFGTFTLTGVARRVEFPIDENLAASPVGTYSYILVANPGVAGAEQIAARGRWFIDTEQPA